MSPHKEEIRARAAQTPFVPFTLVTASGDRINVPSSDHIFFAPNTDEDGNPLAPEAWSDSFIVWGNGSRHRVVFFTGVSLIEVGATVQAKGSIAGEPP